MPPLQRPAAGKVPQCAAPDQDGRTVRQFTEVPAVGFQDDLLGALSEKTATIASMTYTATGIFPVKSEYS